MAETTTRQQRRQVRRRVRIRVAHVAAVQDHRPVQQRLAALGPRLQVAEELRQQLRQMADLVLQALRDALQALIQRDRALAYMVILADNRIDALEGAIDRLCQEFLVRHMPAGGPLRFVISAIKVNSELERLGTMPMPLPIGSWLCTVQSQFQ